MAGKKTGKRLLTWVLVLVMALSLLPLNALAKDVWSAKYDWIRIYLDEATNSDLQDLNGMSKQVRIVSSEYPSTEHGMRACAPLSNYWWTENNVYKVTANKITHIVLAGDKAIGGSNKIPIPIQGNEIYEVKVSEGKEHRVTYLRIDISKRPDAPSYDKLKTLIGGITVNCTNTKASHASKNYTLIEDSYTTSEVAGDAANGYTYTVTINSQKYVAQFDVDTNKAHDPKDGTATVTLKYTDNGWTVTSGTPVAFNVACVTEITPPEKPDGDALNELLGTPVKVECTKTEHSSVLYALAEGDYSIGEVTPDGNGGYTCTITATADKYVAAYVKSKGAHELTGDSTKTITLTWNSEEEKWVAEDDAIPVTFSVECTEAEKVPVHLVIYRNGNTSKAYKDIALESQPKGHVIDLSTIDIADYYTGNYEFYGWYDDGLFNIYKGDPANPPAGLKEKTVNGWTNFKCMVYDYENVVYFRSAEDLTAYQEDHSKTEGRLYSTTALFGSTLPTADAPTPTRTGYTFKFWSREGQNSDVTGQTVNGWTNLYANWEKNIYTVTYTDGVDGEEVFADQTYNVPFEDATPAFNGTPTRDGYKFTGWDPAVPATMPANDLTLYAKWEKNTIPTYKFDLSDLDIIKVNKEFKSKYGLGAERSFEATATIEKQETYTVEVDPDLPINPYPNNRSAANVEPIYKEVGKATGTVTLLRTGKTDVFKFDKVFQLLPGAYRITVKETEGTDRYVNYDAKTYTYEFSVTNEGDISINKPITCTFTNEYTKRHTAATPSKPTLNTGDHYAYVMGYPDGTVRPNGSITRAEVSAILFRLLSDKTRDEYFTTVSSFTDVKAGAWYNNSIATLEKAGVIVDTAKGGAFRPNEAITRAELAAMLAQFSDAKPVKGVKFSDVSAEHWAYEAIAIAAKMGWIEGYPDGTFRPDATITRAEMMTLVNRALERVPSDEDHLLSKRVMLTFPDCKSGDWFYIAVQEATNSHTYERAATEKNGDEQWTALRANRDWTLLEK